MKLARVKVEYTCGLVLMDGASLDVASGLVSIPPRLTRLMTMMQETECSPAFSPSNTRATSCLCLPRWTAPMLSRCRSIRDLACETGFMRSPTRRRTSNSRRNGTCTHYRQHPFMWTNHNRQKRDRERD
jgi:hypothetical protein